jgi:hypothetical protein
VRVAVLLEVLPGGLDLGYFAAAEPRAPDHGADLKVA